jgi:hypothetical protein
MHCPESTLGVVGGGVENRNLVQQGVSMFLLGMELIIANATRIPASEVCLRDQIVVKSHRLFLTARLT